MRTICAVLGIALFYATGSVARDCSAQDDPKTQKDATTGRLQNVERELTARFKTLGPFTKAEGKKAAEAYSNAAEEVFAEQLGNDSKKQAR